MERIVIGNDDWQNSFECAVAFALWFTICGGIYIMNINIENLTGICAVFKFHFVVIAIYQ